jgi:hypothetical protein
LGSLMSDSIKNFKIILQDGTYYLMGAINEHAQLTNIKPQDNLIRLNLEEITFINSLGTRMWVKFWASLANADVEYHRVSLPMMNAISMMPVLLPRGGDIHALKSFCLPYCCLSCSSTTIKIVTPDSLVFEDESAYCELIMCQICGNPSSRAEEDTEFLALLSDEFAVIEDAG